MGFNTFSSGGIFSRIVTKEKGFECEVRGKGYEFHVSILESSSTESEVIVEIMHIMETYLRQKDMGITNGLLPWVTP